MAELVGLYAASHTPVMLNFPDMIPDGQRLEIFAAFEELGRAIAKARPQALVVVSDDHVHNFFLTNFPALCIGAAERYKTPVEHWLKAESRILPGEARLGAHLLTQALESGFDPAFSMELVLDHGMLTPLELARVARDIPVVPLLINCVQPPFPTMRRCYEFGRCVRRALDAYPDLERVAILATGGLSHDIGTPRMGLLNEKFDRDLLRLLEQGEDDAAIAYAADHVHEAGNGAEEVRMWLFAQGAAAGRRFRTRFYQGVANWYTGIGLGEWTAA